MNTVRLSLILAVFAPCAIALVPQTAQAQTVDIRTRLNGPAIGGIAPEGRAGYKNDGRKRAFRTEAKANLGDGTVLTVFLNGVPVGTMTIVAGAGSLSLNTERGNVVPVVSASSTVRVVATDGTTILSGAF